VTDQRENIEDLRDKILAEIKKELRKEGCPKSQIIKLEKAVKRALEVDNEIKS
jgi:hypothetical protein